jgi:hypothetical protein
LTALHRAAIYNRLAVAGCALLSQRVESEAVRGSSGGSAIIVFNSNQHSNEI